MTDQTVADVSTGLAGITTKVSDYLYLPDPSGLYAVLGAVAANRASYPKGRGDPVWLLLVGPASNGKTELLNMLDGLNDLHPASTVTEAGLLCRGRRQADGNASLGGLLVEDWDEIEGRRCGILSLKDLSGLMSRAGEVGEGIFAAFREIYDGQWVRRIGTEGGTALVWTGHAGLVGAVTDAFDDRAESMASLGPRFLLHRMPTFTADQLDAYQDRALANVGAQQAKRQETAQAVAAFFRALRLPAAPDTVANPDALKATALLATLARSYVGRSTGTFRDITAVHEAEMPGRMQAALAQLYGGLRAIGCGPVLAWRITATTGFGSVPALRWRALRHVLTEGPVTSAGLEVATGLPSRLVDQTFEDLAVHGLVRVDGQVWAATDQAATLWARSGVGK